jgi:phosphoglycerol transferase
VLFLSRRLFSRTVAKVPSQDDKTADVLGVARPQGRWSAFGATAAVAGLSILVAVILLQIWKANLRVPFDYGGDAMLMALWLKTTVDHGWTLLNTRLGAPGGLDLHDFPPQADHLHLLLIKMMSWLSSDWALLFNVYFLLGFPLIAAASFAVLRHFRVAVGPAAVASLLYAFLPCRLLKGEVHLYLDTFFQVPLGILVALWVCSDDPPLPRPGRGLQRIRGRPAAAVAICVLVAVTGVYFAFFTGILLVVGGAWASLVRRTWRNTLAGVALAGIIILGLTAGTLPTLVDWSKHGRNPHVAVRHHAESEFYGMKVAQLLLPATGHRVPALRHLKERYDASAPSNVESAVTSLGAVASTGFLALLGLILLGSRGSRPRDDLLRKLAVLNLVAVLVGTVGGFGSLFALLVTPQIRAYSRMNVVIAFLSLFALVLLAERISERWRRMATLALPLVLLLGLLDQVTPAAVRPYAHIQAAYRRDADFIHAIEANIPPGAMVFQLPYHSFPEAGPQERAHDYEQLRAYLHSRLLRWSYPTMQGRSGDAWASAVSQLDAARLVETLGDAGFHGILVDRYGYPHSGAQLEGALRDLLEIEGIVSADGRQAFFSLSTYTERSHAGKTQDELRQRRELALKPLLLLWGSGFFGQERWNDARFRWCSGSCELIIENGRDVELEASLTMTVAAARPPAELIIEGGLLSERLRLIEGGTRLARTLRVPPGRHTIRLRSDGKPAIAPGDQRRLIWRADNTVLEEIRRF